MYYRNSDEQRRRTKDEQLLKTKIVATIGKEDVKRLDRKQNEYLRVPYQELFEWFVQPRHTDCFMVDVMRLNMAFYNIDKSVYTGVFDWLRSNKGNKLTKNVAILCDLAGGKTRLGKIDGGKAELSKGSPFKLLLSLNDSGNSNQASVIAYEEPLSELRISKRKSKTKEDPHILEKLNDHLIKKEAITISIGDGKIILKADAKDNKDLETSKILNCVVYKEGIISDGKGVTFEEIDLGLPPFEKQDEKALRFILDLDAALGFVAFIGVSFVREAEDILRVREFIEKNHSTSARMPKPKKVSLHSPDIIAKIETKAGADNIDEILDVADGVMVARGDLALQLGHEEVPERQKDIIRLCNQRGKVVITATEMLSSMEEKLRPTRAEVNDVFNAILDGTDAVMLSGETADGLYPAQAVEEMAKIAERAELYFEKIYERGSSFNAQRLQELRRCSGKLIEKTNARLRKAMAMHLECGFRWAADLYQKKLEKSKDQYIADTICEAGCQVAEVVKSQVGTQSAEEPECKGIVVSTGSGRTARMISRFRPSVNIIAIARNDMCRRKLLLSYGVCPVNIGSSTLASGKGWNDTDEVFVDASKMCKSENLIKKGTNVIFVGGNPLGEAGKVNVLQIKRI